MQFLAGMGIFSPIFSIDRILVTKRIPLRMTQHTATSAIPTQQKTYDMVIVGGGISALSMAHFCAKQGWSVLVLEATEQVGGALHSHHFNAPADDFWIELGAHSCFNSYGHLLTILDDLGLLTSVQKQATTTFRFWRDHKKHSIYSQLHWFSLLANIPKLFTQKKTGRTVKDYYSSLFGEKNYQQLFKHAFNAIICQAADDFPAEQLFRKKARRKEVLKSFSLPKGLQSIAQAITEYPNIDIQTQTTVTELAFSDAVFQVKTQSSNTLIKSRYITLATPADTTKNLLKPAFSHLAVYLETLAIMKIETVGVLVNKIDSILEPLAGIIAADDAFYSLVSRDTVTHQDYRGFTFHFKPQVLTKTAKHALICEVLDIGHTDIIEWVEKVNYLPALRLEHQALLNALDEKLTTLPLAITGNYFNGVSIEDCVTRSKVEFERLLKL